MRKISYFSLQNKYPKKLVGLNKEETKVVVVGSKFDEIFQKLEKLHVEPKDCVFIGPIQRKGAINVYFSLRG